MAADKPHSPSQLAAIRKFYENDPALPKLAEKLGLTKDALLVRLATQAEPIFHVAPDYDLLADTAAFETQALSARVRHDFRTSRTRDARADRSPDTVRVTKRAPRVGARNGSITGPAADLGVRSMLVQSRTHFKKL